jgi:hypothetical protein|tara:strand:+ start:113 stop:1435 length:1323 start_codon:yes stop_codon:yes gene_type:complete
LKYDRSKDSANNNREHAMIKTAVSVPWTEADRILKDIKSGKNYFASGGEQISEFLPQKLLALYFYITGHEIYDSKMNLKINNGKLPYLIIKTSLYYLALLYFCKKIFSMFPLKNCFFIILFLAFEPSIFQYHSSFWNVSLFLPFEILLLSLLLDQSENILKNVFIGFILGIMFMIRPMIFWYIFPLLFYLFILYKKKSTKPISGLMIGYLLILVVIAFHNYKRVGIPYFMPTESKFVLSVSLAPQILAKKENLSVEQAKLRMKDEIEIWIKKNDLNLNINNSLFGINIGGKEEDRIKYYDYIQKTALDIIINNPLITAEYVFKQSLHMLVLNPVYVKYFYQFEGRGGKYLKSETHKKWIPIRIIYSVIIYLVVFWGIINSLKNMKKEIIFLLIVSSAYILAILGWMGIPRHFVPALIFLSIFFGNGMAAILKSNTPNISK